MTDKDDSIIKNPARNMNNDIQDHYIPEYIRLGVTPVVQDFASLDGEIFPENVELLDSHILDNNDSINYGYNVKQPIKNKIPMVGEFVLMVNGKVILYGDHDHIMTEAKSILYGEHKNLSNVKIEDLIILKRIGLKVGVFLDE